MNTITPFEAVKRMRQLTKAGVPFTFSFMSYNATKHSSDGVKEVGNAQLRQGYRRDQSDKADVLVGYVNGLDADRWFYLPLLLKFNDYQIKP